MLLKEKFAKLPTRDSIMTIRFTEDELDDILKTSHERNIRPAQFSRTAILEEVRRHKEVFHEHEPVNTNV